ncbi:MAG TPA: PA0069 family radical SAM protein [Planctomycetota bacterium]|nr:PA0069 family radical SAM protein [Planctomycetota bacterium]
MDRPISNPPNPWSTSHVEWLGEPPQAQLTVYEEEAKSILAENDSPDIPFRWSVNPYRGCQHACAYCYARPTHQYLGFGAGTDFDTRIVVKVNAAELLRKALSRRGWKKEPITFSGVTDCYQPLEASYGVTRACLEVCVEFAQPIGMITKSALVRRDIDLLAKLSQRAAVRVFVSIPYANAEVARAVEPWAAAPAMRFATLRALAEAGIECGVGICPMIPGLSDSDIPSILQQARAAGATSAFMGLLRLPAEVSPVFQERIRAAFPGRAEKIFSAQRDMRGGKLNESNFGERMHGVGPRWAVIERLFDVHCAKLGFDTRDEQRLDALQPAQPPTQGLLFEA